VDDGGSVETWVADAGTLDAVLLEEVIGSSLEKGQID